MEVETEQDKYRLFLEWFKANGGVYEEAAISYPVFYQPGNYVGVGAIANIPKNKVIVAIPFHLIITVNRAKAELDRLSKEIYAEIEEDSEDLEFLILALYLAYHRLQGKGSFFYPYFNIVESPESLCEWTSAETVLLEDEYLVKMVSEEREAELTTFDHFRKYSGRFRDLYPRSLTLKDFKWCYNFVRTRSYGWGFPETMLVPFGDLFNHSNQDRVNHYMFNRVYELGTERPHPSYIMKGDCLNIELLGVKSREWKTYQPHQKILILQEFFPEVQQSDLVEEEQTYWQRYLSENLHNNLEEMELFESSDSEDNDSEEQEEEMANTWEEQIQKFRRIENPPKEYLNLQVKHFKRPSLPIDKEFKEENDFSWYQHSDKNTYFIMSTSELTRPGQQIFNSYGQRSNRFLLLHYGFCLDSNRCNSVTFRLRRDNIEDLRVYRKYVTYEEQCEGVLLERERIPVDECLTEEFRLKESRLCEKLIMYLRFQLMKSRNSKDIKMTFPTNLHCELEMLQMYQTVLSQLREAYNSEILLEDIKLLRESPQMSPRHAFAVMYRISNKRVVELQWCLLNICLGVVGDLIRKVPLKDAISSPRPLFERDELFGNKQGRVFYTQRVVVYLRPLSYLCQ